MNKNILKQALLVVLWGSSMIAVTPQSTLRALPMITGAMSAQIIATEWKDSAIGLAMLGLPIIAGLVAKQTPDSKKEIKSALATDFKMAVAYLIMLKGAGISENLLADVGIKALGSGLTWGILSLF